MRVNDFSDSLEKTRSYAAYNKDEEIRMNSSSGGVFYLLAKYVLNMGGTVFGASINGKGEVYHKRCTELSQLIELMRSKYVQSELRDSFHDVKNDLLDDKIVLFCGTPCQAYGIRAFINQLTTINPSQKNKLITTDFVCHGVPSKKIWRQYFKEITDGNAADIINFRDKASGWINYSLRINTNGTMYYKSHYEDPYLSGFINNLYLRPSCFKCMFRGIDRNTDFTLADFWKVETVLPDMFDDKGTSIVLVHTKKAMSIWNQIQNELVCQEIDNDIVIKTNTPVIRSATKHLNSDRFFKYLLEDQPENISETIASFVRVSFIQRVWRKVMRIINSYSNR